MKKVRLVFGLVILIWSFAVIGYAAMPQGQLVEVAVKGPSGRAETIAAGWLSDTEIWVPVSVIPGYIKEDAAIDAKAGRLRLAIAKPDFTLETKALDDRLHNGITLNFLARVFANQYFVNLKGMEKVLGISLYHDQENGRLIIEKPDHLADRKLNKVRPDWKPDGKLHLVWDYIAQFSPDLAKEPTIQGLDVISPTWFSIESNGKVVINNADMKYIRDAHRKGYKVWPLFKNGDFDPDLTRKFLADQKLQDAVITQLLVYISMYDLDGLNIDFEDVYEADRDRLTAFVRRLTDALREQNVPVSIDVTVPSSSPNWSRCYDRVGLGQIVDYVMVMTYDEYWASSQVSGPVASFGWVDSNMNLLVNQYIPKEKLVMGIPFYAREWRETVDEYGRKKVSSKACGMEAVREKVRVNNLTPVWLADKGLYYVEYEKDGSTYKIWIEDERSIALKAGLVAKYDLAGAAVWRKSFADNNIWQVLAKHLKPAQ